MSSAKIKLGKIIRNNIYMLCYIYKYCPGHFALTLFNALMGSVSSVLNLYLTRYIINSISSGELVEGLFQRVTVLIICMLVFNIVLLIINAHIQNRVIPKNTQIIHQKMQLELFKKAVSVELSCYEDTDYFNKFSMAMQQSDSRALAVLNTLSSFLGSVFGISALSTLIGTFEPVIILVVLLNVAVSFFINARTIKIQHANTQERIPICSRYPIEAGRGYGLVKAHFEGNLPKSAAVYNGFHAQIVINAKEHCRKKPLCDGCPLAGTCRRCGV
jgi:ATP-binding cassette subfamily B protein